MRFKVGDKVKSKYGFGTIKEIKSGATPILVYHDNWSNGHNGNGIAEKIYLGNCCWWFEEDGLELVEEPIKTTEMKIDRNLRKAKPFKITTDDLLAPNNVDLEEQYKRYVLGTWDKENPILKKEGNKMIESMNLIDLYASKHKESIERETKEKIEKIRKESSIREKYDEITQKCKDDLQKLYISQFTDEEIEKAKEKAEGLSGYQKELQHKTSICEFGYFINNYFKNDEIIRLETDMVNKVEGLNDLVKTVKAHVGIAKTKEEVEEILTRYGIIDKKGKLVI